MDGQINLIVWRNLGNTWADDSLNETLKFEIAGISTTYLNGHVKLIVIVYNVHVT